MAFTQSVDLESSSSQYASISDAAQSGLQPTTAFSVEAWVRFESLPGTNQDRQFISKWNPSGSQRSYRFGIQNISGNNNLTIGVSSGGDVTETANVAISPSTGVWYRYAVSWSSGNWIMYQDGTQIGSGTTTATSLFNNNTDFVLGASEGGGTGYWDGNLSLVRVWTVSRTQQEFDDNECTILGTTTGLGGEWVLDGDFTDNSGNGNTLTAANSPVFVSEIPATCAVTPNTGQTQFSTLMGVGQ